MSSSAPQTQSPPAAPNCSSSDDLLESFFHSFFTKIEHDRAAAFRPRFATSPFQFWSSLTLDDDALELGMINDSIEKRINEQLKNTTPLMSSGASLETKATESFDLFDLPFIDGNTRNNLTKPCKCPKNGVYFGNQYVPNFDCGSANEDVWSTSSDGDLPIFCRTYDLQLTPALQLFLSHPELVLGISHRASNVIQYLRKAFSMIIQTTSDSIKAEEITESQVPVDDFVPSFSSQTVTDYNSVAHGDANLSDGAVTINESTTSHPNAANFGSDLSTKSSQTRSDALTPPNDSMPNQSTSATTTDNNTNSNTGYGQRSNYIERHVLTTGYAQAVVPNAQVLPTLEASNIDPNHTQSTLGRIRSTVPQQAFQQLQNSLPWSFSGVPTTSSSSIPQASNTSPIPTAATLTPCQPNDENRSVSGQPEMHDGQILPPAQFYTIEDGKFICRYIGPARPRGCSTKNGNVRSLWRHLRTHAFKENSMNIPSQEKVICNRIPADSLNLTVICPFNKPHQLDRCRYYRETGQIWQMETLDRWEKVMMDHKSEYHE
ncbi:hypothetical protein Clacol_004357 [Clathrus columnatus]|uniref:Uncharacterized protein n=1 Tax=Clathrus columnatus TaxID=1419009 RepID=A0AAV5ACB1_9AGAM|nr:hypothetical protein Clacol_004357 [Clathrus columnatus]